MESTNTPENCRRFPDLEAEEQTIALAALDEAVGQAIAAGADPDTVRDVGRRSIHLLARAPDGQVVLLVPVLAEDPRSFRHELGRFWPTYVEGYTAAAQEVKEARGGPAEIEEVVLWMCCREAWRPMPLTDGLRLLASDASPSEELARRKGELAKYRADWAAAQEAERRHAHAEAERRREEDTWRLDNATRIALWDALPRPAQALLDLAEKLPAFADLLRALADTAAKVANGRSFFSMPDSFRPELARRPAMLAGRPAPKVEPAPGPVTAASQS